MISLMRIFLSLPTFFLFLQSLPLYSLTLSLPVSVIIICRFNKFPSLFT